MKLKLEQGCGMGLQLGREGLKREKGRREQKGQKRQGWGLVSAYTLGLDLRPKWRRSAVLAAVLGLGASAVQAQHMYNGIMGYVNTPSALMRRDGDFVVGGSHATPYSSLYTAVQFLPWLEAYAMFMKINDVPTNFAYQKEDYGDYKDKAVGFKLRLVPENAFETDYVPAFSIGSQDLGVGNSIFAAYYAVASKNFHFGKTDVEMSLGYGSQRMQGPFGGLRLRYADLPGWSVAMDYDSLNFANDKGAEITGVNKRKHGNANAVLEYRSTGGWGVQMGVRDRVPTLNASLFIPFEEPQIADKAEASAPFVGLNDPAGEGEWGNGGGPKLMAMLKALSDDGFRDVKASYSGKTVHASLSSRRYLQTPRAIGRAMRILLAYSPGTAEKIKVTLMDKDIPVFSAQANNLSRLQEYFNGAIPLATLRPSIEAKLGSNADRVANSTVDALFEQVRSEALQAEQDSKEESTGSAFDFRRAYESVQGHSFSVAPYVSTFFNDPSGALKAALGVAAEGQVKLADQLYLNGEATVELLENISDVTQASNSKLPHVRTDVALYYRSSKGKLNRLVLNHFAHPWENIFVRSSLGLYETMYAGIGTQWMYAPDKAGWSADVAVDYLKQRDYKDPFAFLPYKTTTALASFHLELPYNVTSTVRLGRFLAQDTGARFELKRTLPSGAQFGTWYSRTNGNDLVDSKPYYDKGVSLQIPFDFFSPNYTKRMLPIAISPWTRDVGQMVRSPADLRSMLEREALRPLESEKESLQGFSGIDHED